MPWHVGEKGSNGCAGYSVIKDADGSKAGCHPTKEAAQRQIAALYANEANMGKNAALGENVLTAIREFNERAQMSAQSINDLPDSAFAYIEPGGKKDDQGKTVPRSLRHFPIHDAAHVANALARAPQSPFGSKAMPKIIAAAKKFGVGDYGKRQAERTSMSTGSFLRLFPLEDIRILSRAQGSEYADGRTVEAYAAVFDSATEIHDVQGQYLEVIDRAAFNKAISDAQPQGRRTGWRVGVFYNHAMTIQGTPSERGSMPIGVPIDIRAEERGLLTVSRYAETPLADEVLELIRSGAINSQSFSGRIIRSDPQPPRLGYQRGRNGELTTVRRLELGLREYGPTPFAAYPDAAVLSVRTMTAWPTVSTTSEAEPAEIDTSSLDAVPDEPPTDDEHSSRDLHRAAVLQRIAEARRTRPGLA